MWSIFKALMLYELRQLWRSLLRRPEPPGRFVRYRERIRVETGPAPDPGDDLEGNPPR
jgi:hypothetical protein